MLHIIHEQRDIKDESDIKDFNGAFRVGCVGFVGHFAEDAIFGGSQSVPLIDSGFRKVSLFIVSDDGDIDLGVLGVLAVASDHIILAGNITWYL